MDRSLHDEDFFAWSERQAAALRRLATSRPRSNDLDIENVAEEIEDLGKNLRDAAESYVRLILVHLLKLAAAPEAPAVKHWRSEIVTFHIDLQSKLTPAIAGRMDLDRLWRQAKRQARARLDEADQLDPKASVWTISAACPFVVEDFATEELDIDALVARLALDARSFERS